MWQFLVKAAIGSIIMKAKPIKKMVKRFMRGAVKKLGKTAGTLIGGAALMILGGYATNGAFGFGKGFFGGVEGAKQARSVFDLIGRAKDAFSTAGSEMTSFTDFLKGGIDKVKGSAETGTDLGTGIDTVDPIPAESFNPETLLSDSTSNLENIDAAVYEWVDEHLNINTETHEGFKKVPVIWVTAERSFQIKNSEDLHDSDGALIYPLITVGRTGFSKDLAKKGMRVTGYSFAKKI